MDDLILTLSLILFCLQLFLCAYLFYKLRAIHELLKTVYVLASVAWHRLNLENKVKEKT